MNNNNNLWGLVTEALYYKSRNTYSARPVMFRNAPFGFVIALALIPFFQIGASCFWQYGMSGAYLDRFTSEWPGHPLSWHPVQV